MGDRDSTQLDTQGSNLKVLWMVVRAIPVGSVTSYGALGKALPNPVSGFFVGKWMAMCPDDGTPWWRVVAADGELPIAKRDPELGLKQRGLLEREGVPFEEDIVSAEAFWNPLEHFHH